LKPNVMDIRITVIVDLLLAFEAPFKCIPGWHPHGHRRSLVSVWTDCTDISVCRPVDACNVEGLPTADFPWQYQSPAITFLSIFCIKMSKPVKVILKNLLHLPCLCQFPSVLKYLGTV
jgi:hypothetical protein